MNAIRFVPEGAEIRGVPVVYDEHSPELAHAAGVWPFKRIVVGPEWFALEAEEQAAILMHEVYHCRALHMEVRWLLFPFCWTRFAREIGKRQEFAADRYAAREGYQHELVMFLARHGRGPTSPFHPSTWDRIDSLLKPERSRT